MVKLLKLGKSEEEIKDLENREGKLNKKTIKRYLFLDAHKIASSDDILKFENHYNVSLPYEYKEFLKKNNKQMILATSSDLHLAEALTEGKDIKKYFSHLVTAEDVVHGKPDPEVFLISAKKAGASPEKTVVFEDSFNGIRAAHAAGTFPIMVPDKLKPTEEIEKLVYKKFDNLMEVLDYFEGK